MGIQGMLVTTMTFDLQHEIKEVDRLARCETESQMITLLADIVRDMERLTEKYRDMLARLEGRK